MFLGPSGNTAAGACQRPDILDKIHVSGLVQFPGDHFGIKPVRIDESLWCYVTILKMIFETKSISVKEDLDSEGEERTKKKPSKFKDDLKLKKKFNALLRKMKLNDADEPMIDDEVCSWRI